MNEKNLIPNTERSPSEVRENGRKGGIASGKARREKKRLKELLELALDKEIENAKTGEKATKKEVAMIQLADQMASGFLKAIKLGAEILGEDDPTRIDITSGGQPFAGFRSVLPDLPGIEDMVKDIDERREQAEREMNGE